jgi:glycosyltransferase involved in cell wall biosynthesis
MISVVIPVYNRPTLITRAINSVLDQNYKKFELIVVDDGSTDETPEVLKSFGEKIKVITTKNFGVSHARNQGIKSAIYPWISFIDSDDAWHEDKLKIQMDFHKLHLDILFSHTNEKWIRGDKEIKQKKHHKKPSGYCFDENLDFCKIAPSTVMIKKEIFEEIGYFDEELEVCEDYDMWLRVLKEHQVGLIEEILTTKYAQDNQLSMKYHSMDKQRVQALLKHKEKKSVKDEILKKVRVLEKGAIKHQNVDLIKYCEVITTNI